MKKTFLLITIIVLNILTANAQVPVSFGIKAGGNVSSIVNVSSEGLPGYDDIFDKSKIKLGGQFGIYKYLSLGKVLGLQPEVLFSMKGFRYENNEVLPIAGGTTNSSSESNLRLNYIEIPFQLRIDPVKKIFILAGPYVGILIQASKITARTVGSVSWTDKSSSVNEFKPLDWGMTLGMGFKAGKGFMAGFKYSRGFSSIYSVDERKNVNENSVFQFFVGYEFEKKIVSKKQ